MKGVNKGDNWSKGKGKKGKGKSKGKSRGSKGYGKKGKLNEIGEEENSEWWNEDDWWYDESGGVSQVWDPTRHLGCIKPCRNNGVRERFQLVQQFVHQQ